MRDFRNLDVWVKGHVLVLGVYDRTRHFPRMERFGLTVQMRDCARSIPANIAEGCGRRSRSDFARFLDIAAGSANELAYYVGLARDLEYVTPDVAASLEAQVAEVGRMLVGLAATVRRTP